MSGKNSSNERSKADIESLAKLERMLQMRQEALDIQNRLMDSDIDVVRAGEKDLGYFLVLIETAVGYYNQEGYDTGTVH